MAQKSSKQRAEEAVLDLKGKIRKLNNELTSKGVPVAVNAPLVDTIKAVVMMKEVREEVPMTLFKKEQFYGWREETLPPLKLKDGDNISLRYTFAGMKALKALPEIAGIERSTDISYMCHESSALKSATLGEMPLVVDASSSFYGCLSIERISIGDMPLCNSLNSFAYGDPTLKSISLGTTPKVTNIYSIAYGCHLLEEFTANIGDNLSDVRWAFGDCPKLRQINGALNFSGASDTIGTFNGCTSLEEVRIKGLKVSLDLSACQSLSMESIRYLVDKAQTVKSGIIDLSRKLLEAHEEELGDLGDTASDKGWTLNYR